MLGRQYLFGILSGAYSLTLDHSFSLVFSCHSLRFIYELVQCGNLDWVYGGEYGELYRLTTVVVKGWLAVGLKPHFVFDGERALDYVA